MECADDIGNDCRTRETFVDGYVLFFPIIFLFGGKPWTTNLLSLLQGGFEPGMK